MSKTAEKVTSKPNKDVEKLKRELELYDMAIEDDAGDASAYFMKAGALYKLWQLQADEKYKEGALENYNQAIKLDSENALYFIDRARLYNKIGQCDLASFDVVHVKQLPINNDTTGIYVRNSLKELETLLPTTSLTEAASSASSSLAHTSISSVTGAATNDENEKMQEAKQSDINTNFLNSNSSCQANNTCLFMGITSVIYNNTVLNHLDLLEPAINLYGFNKVIGLTSKLDEVLISTAISTKDPELILAGLVSLACIDEV